MYFYKISIEKDKISQNELIREMLFLILFFELINNYFNCSYTCTLHGSKWLGKLFMLDYLVMNSINLMQHLQWYFSIKAIGLPLYLETRKKKENLEFDMLGKKKNLEKPGILIKIH